MILSLEEAAMKPSDLALKKEILAKIGQHYPDHVHFFRVTVKSGKTEGVIQVVHLGVTAEMGYQIAMKGVVNDPDLRQIVYFTGELLERYKLSREKHVDIIDQLQGVKRNNIGRAVHEQ